MSGQDSMGSLADILAARIRASGPLPVADFMGLCLGHETHGYYMKQVPFGREGDFTTAPEISQVFGELIGLHLADLWLRAGSPAPVQLVELGPGRGTLMADLLRATARVPGFHAALDITFVEMSPVLRAEQKSRVPHARWADRLADVPEGRPLLLVANEFFDALPARQLVKTALGWQERHVDWQGGRFVPVVPADAPRLDSLVPPALRAAPEGSVFEVLGGAEELALLNRRLTQDGGAALIIDYGHDRHSLGDTLQAMRAHAYADPFAAPGDADLTVHVDFAQVAARAGAGLRVLGPAGQGRFLRALGLDIRTAVLAKANPPKAEALVSASRRLADSDQMGALFKVLSLSHPEWPAPAGFDA